MQPAEQEEYLYRYIGFDSFVNMVQNQALHFVLPSMWEDPAETFAFEVLMLQQEEFLEKVMFASLENKVYAQCWTRLSESDAMWRIYSFNNKALRLRIQASHVNQLSQVERIDVVYDNDVEKILAVTADNEKSKRAWAIKREAFSHEQEVRLLWRYRFTSDDDFYDHIKAWMAIYAEEWKDSVKAMESFDPDIEKAVDIMVKKVNANKQDSVKAIPYGHIPDFIAGVMVHPLAPQWYVETVRQYCADHNIPFDGQSTLYKKPEHKIVAQAKEK